MVSSDVANLETLLLQDSLYWTERMAFISKFSNWSQNCPFQAPWISIWDGHFWGFFLSLKICSREGFFFNTNAKTSVRKSDASVNCID